MYYRVSFEAVVFDSLPVFLLGFALATLLAYVAYRKWRSICAFILPVVLVAVALGVIYATVELAQWSFSYNGTHLRLQLGDEVFNVDVRGCEKAWIEDARVRGIQGIGTPGIVAGLLRVEGVGEGYGLVAHTRSVLYITCGNASYIIGVPGLKP